jgi:hypothetical protein
MITLLAFAIFLQTDAASPPFLYQVKHEHTIGSCFGTLTFYESEVRFETREKKHQRTWTYPDVQFFEIVSPAELRIHSYEDEGVLKLGHDRDFTFRLTSGQLTKELYEFLIMKSPRTVVTHVVFSGTEVIQEIPVRHRHRLGGCQGTLTIAQDKIIYRTDQPGDSRTWPLKDVESFASNDPFQLRVSTAFETFTFDLKLPLKEATYEHIWKAVHSP